MPDCVLKIQKKKKQPFFIQRTHGYFENLRTCFIFQLWKIVGHVIRKDIWSTFRIWIRDQEPKWGCCPSCWVNWRRMAHRFCITLENRFECIFDNTNFLKTFYFIYLPYNSVRWAKRDVYLKKRNNLLWKSELNGHEHEYDMKINIPCQVW